MASKFTIKFDDEQTAAVLVRCIKGQISQLGLQLEIDPKKISSYEKQNRDTNSLQGTLQMLNDWRKDEKENQIPTLRSALFSSLMVEVEKDIMSQLKFSQEQIDAFAQRIGNNDNFSKLCNKLGFGADRATGFQNQNINGSCAGTMSMLSNWQGKTAKNQIPTLEKALQASGMSDIATVL